MKVLVTGANGLLGRHLVKLLLQQGYPVIATGKGVTGAFPDAHAGYRYYPLDITDEDALERILMTERPDAVVHAAAMTQVDECELNRDLCFRVNTVGTCSVISYAELYSSFLICLSTDFVFDGEKGNYRENDRQAPVNWYGTTKKYAEQFVRSCSIPWAIVRTCLVYGPTSMGMRNNIVGWVAEKLGRSERIRVVDDQVRTPTYAGDLARGILLILDKKARGAFHISGKDILTPYDMAVQTAAFLSLDKNLIERVNALTFSQPAKRPPKTGFIIDRARKELGYEPLSFAEGLQQMFG